MPIGGAPIGAAFVTVGTAPEFSGEPLAFVPADSAGRNSLGGFVRIRHSKQLVINLQSCWDSTSAVMGSSDPLPSHKLGDTQIAMFLGFIFVKSECKTGRAIVSNSQRNIVRRIGSSTANNSVSGSSGKPSSAACAMRAGPSLSTHAQYRQTDVHTDTGARAYTRTHKLIYYSTLHSLCDSRAQSCSRHRRTRRKY